MSSIPALSRARQQFPPILGGVAIITASYLFLSALTYQDHAGQQTLAWLALLVTLLRGLGRLITVTTKQIFIVPILLLLSLAAALTLVFLRRYRPRTWHYDSALALLVPALLATAALMLGGYLLPAALTGLLAGGCLLACGGLPAEREPSKLLVLVPLGLGAVLRFYALAAVPNGYAEHAVVHHVEYSIPYFEALTSSLQALRLQPFLAIAANALVREQFGSISLVAAMGFELFGVSLIVTRLVSAALGTLTIYVAYCLGRAVDSIRLGLVFAFLLAVSPWHITISRYADQEHVLAPLQLLLSLLFLILAVNGGRVRHIILAALSIGLSWYIYAVNLVVPAIAGLFLLCRAAIEPRLAIGNSRRVLLGLVCFALLSYAALTQLLPQGLFQPNIRTGYRASGSILSDFPKRMNMIGVEADQLFRKADDPWFTLPGGGLGVLQSTLLVPGLVLAAAALRQRRQRDLALLVLLGLPLAALPAVFAPDPSFRRLILVATLAALIAAFTLLRLADAVRGSGIPARALTLIACVGALALGAAGAFGYFDRVFVGEEMGGNASFRSLAERVSGLLGKRPLVVVVPRHDNLTDTHRYIKLVAYDTLLDALQHGVPQEALYLTTTCEDSVEQGSPQSAGASPPVLVIHEAVLEPHAPCGPEFVSRLEAHYPGSDIVIAKTPTRN